MSGGGSRLAALRHTLSQKVRPGMELDVSRLAVALRGYFSDPRYFGARDPEPGSEHPLPNVTMLQGGLSNPTYLLDWADPRLRKLVLRKQPPGSIRHGTHAVNREFKAMSAMHTKRAFVPVVPVAQPHVLIEDPIFIGTSFFVCDYVPGRSFVDASMPDAASPQERSAMHRSLVKAMCALHTAAPPDLGLENFGRGEGYLSRQLGQWSEHYQAAELEVIEPMEWLSGWLGDALVDADDGVTSVVHGDFRLENVLFNTSGPELAALVDWEHATLGHPAADLATFALPHVLPAAAPPRLRGYGEVDLEALGIPTEQTLVDTYVDRTGLDSVRASRHVSPRQDRPNLHLPRLDTPFSEPAGGASFPPAWQVRDHFDCYMAFACFRLAASLTTLHRRALDGRAIADDAEALGRCAEGVAEAGRACARRYELGAGRLTRAAAVGSAAP